jgi:hypothetical protein
MTPMKVKAVLTGYKYQLIIIRSYKYIRPWFLICGLLVVIEMNGIKGKSHEYFCCWAKYNWIVLQKTEIHTYTFDRCKLHTCYLFLSFLICCK